MKPDRNQEKRRPDFSGPAKQRGFKRTTHQSGDINPTSWRILEQPEAALQVIVNVRGRVAIVERNGNGDGLWGTQAIEIPTEAVTAVIRGLRAALAEIGRAG